MSSPKEDEFPPQSKTPLMKATFISLGISALIAWNAVLSNLNYFEVNQLDPESTFQKPGLMYPMLFNFLSMVLQFFMIFRDIPISYKNLFIFSQVMAIVLILILPLTVIPFEKKSKLGFFLTCANLLLQGFANAISFYSTLGICGFFPSNCIVAYSMGQGVAGIMMNLINYACIFAIPDNEVVQAWIYFGITAGIMIIALIIFLKAYQDEYFVNTLTAQPMDNKIEDDERDKPLFNNEGENNKSNTSVEIAEGLQNMDKIVDVNVNQSRGAAFLELLKETLIVNVMIVICYIVTFTVYPNGCDAPIFFNNSNKTWLKIKFTTIAFLYNICDTTSRELTKYLPLTKTCLNVATLIRFILYFTIPLNVFVSIKGKDFLSGIILILNVIFLASSNGISNTLCFALAPTLVTSESKKGRAASTVGFFTIVGIEAGTYVGWLMDKVIEYVQNHFK